MELQAVNLKSMCRPRYAYSVSVVCIFTLAACAANNAPTEEKRLASVIRANGCQVSKSEADRVLGTQGFTPDIVSDITDRWKAQGLVTTSPGPEREVLYLGSVLCDRTS